MSQTRLYLTVGRTDADRAFAAFELAFEEEGFPLAVRELDEDRDIHEVSLYADSEVEEIEERMRQALAGLSLDNKIEREVLPDIDWVALSLEGLKPVRAGRFVVHGSHDRQARRAGELAIEIEAGLAFGTGHHGTTSGCLEMIEMVAGRERPRNALDLGTGSAVLAIALAKLLRIPVLATDIDPIATRVASDNARLNGVAALVETHTAPGFHHPIFAARGPFELIVANILARPLMKLAPQMARHLVPGGSLILSGILERQRNAVLAAYVGQSFRHVSTLAREGWVTLHLKR
ncbi:50S ribosomal protein L11 methyltransferase [Pseudaminobacter sp. NGMCC 1.201702]|uniref:50S ribosomal protein L11 methyltransferase n=1 Tax=Pseudaminobacter sp. NGMCC 1.201702 TaxID=3391825 RepID=UPI0039F1476B